jgi:GT2 family glycosyltransferase
MIPVLIIPILNRYDLLDQALASIDYPIEEILIINNGEEKYESKREDLNVRVLNLPSNLGVSGSWNLGIKLYPYAQYWMFSSVDTKFLPETLPKFNDLSNSDRMVRSTASYNCFTLGENIVKRVGLFDEYIYPAYFEDNDYEERMTLEGIIAEGGVLGDIVPVESFGNSLTINSDVHYAIRNGYTFEANRAYLDQKRATADYSCRGWELERRRQNEWRR